MKEVKWEACATRGAISSYPPKSGKMPNPSDKVTVGMMVSARYKGLDVFLRILREIKEGVFDATILCFETVLSQKPRDLAEGDEVRISREYICWIHDN